MIVKWLKKTGNGSARATVDYMLGKDRQRAGAKALNGLEKTERTAKLADSLRHKHKYAVGVLSFEEAPGAISIDQKIEIIESFERTIFAGLEPDQYDISWIEHTDKRRLELNFIIPKVELRSGRAMNPYLHGKDTPLIDSWKNIINAEYGLSDPNDPAKRHSTTHRQRLPKDKRELVDAINESITLAITAGTIQNRADIIDHLAALGLEVTKTTKQSLSVHHADMGKRPLRLTGAYYEQNFDASKIDQDYIAARSAEYRARTQERLRENKTEYQRLLESRSKYNQSRYSHDAIAISSDSRRRIRSSDQPSNRADQAADQAVTAAHQFTDQRTRSADLAATDHPATAVIHGDRSASRQDERRSDLVQDPTGSINRAVRATAGSSQEDAGQSSAGSRSATVEYRQHVHDDQAIAGQASENVRIRSASIQNDGRTGWAADAASDISHRIDDAAHAETHRSDTAAHDSTDGSDRQDSRQAGRIDHTQAIPAHILSAGSDRMDYAATASNSVQQLQRVQQPQNSERTRRGYTTKTSDLVKSNTIDQYSDDKSAIKFSDDRTDERWYSDKVTTSRVNRDYQQNRAHSEIGSKSITNQEMIEHEHPFFTEIQAAFRRIRTATARAATTLLDEVRERVTAALESSRSARNYYQQSDDQNRDIDSIIAAAEQRKRRSADAARTLSTDDQRASETDRRIEQAAYDIKDTDRAIERYSRETEQTSQYIDFFNSEVQKRVETVIRHQQETQKQVETSELEQRKQEEQRTINKERERQRTAQRDDYDSPSPF